MQRGFGAAQYSSESIRQAGVKTQAGSIKGRSIFTKPGDKARVKTEKQYKETGSELRLTAQRLCKL